MATEVSKGDDGGGMTEQERKEAVEQAARKSTVYGILVTIIFLVSLGANWWVQNNSGWNGKEEIAWFSTTALLLLTFVLLGPMVGRRWFGVIVDFRNKPSSSRLQIALWTIVVISTVVTATVYNIVANAIDPMSFSIPGNVLAVLGISAVGVGGSQLLKVTADRAGKLHSHSDVKKANIRNLIEEEDQNPDETSVTNIDVSKVQMLMFTVIGIVTYSAVVLKWISGDPGTAGLMEFPDFSEGLMAIIAISHGTYLGIKATPNNDVRDPVLDD
ncbi:MAG: hypothetical protein H8D69_02420 [Chloroflexi bacterium]|nr:hypothetical protein [Chloroflexota bacterium]